MTNYSYGTERSKTCDVCGQWVGVSTNKEGTSFYIPLEKQRADDMQNMLVALAKRTIPGEMDSGDALRAFIKEYNALVESAAQAELASSRDREYLVRGIKRLKTLHYYVTVKAYLPTIEEECIEELAELNILCTQIKEKLETCAIGTAKRTLEGTDTAD